MNYHESNNFQDAILAASGHFNIRSTFIEKDYWVTYVLKNLANSAYNSQVVFKGGTSLSKAYQCIDRFSEDIDLALLKQESDNDNQLKKIIKKVENACTEGLTYFQHEHEEKRGRNRRTFYNYPTIINEQNFGPVKDHIQLEINTFTNPVPFQLIKINSYVGQFLEEKGFKTEVDKYNLQPFDIQVLAVNRTFFEKLSSLIRLSYDGVDKLKEKIRHFYDLYKIISLPDNSQALLCKQSYTLFEEVLKDDRNNRTFHGNWIEEPFSQSPIFENVEGVWGSLMQSYRKELTELSWTTEIPNEQEIQAMLLEVKTFLHDFDAKK